MATRYYHNLGYFNRFMGLPRLFGRYRFNLAAIWYLQSIVGLCHLIDWYDGHFEIEQNQVCSHYRCSRHFDDDHHILGRHLVGDQSISTGRSIPFSDPFGLGDVPDAFCHHRNITSLDGIT